MFCVDPIVASSQLYDASVDAVADPLLAIGSSGSVFQTAFESHAFLAIDLSGHFKVHTVKFKLPLDTESLYEANEFVHYEVRTSMSTYAYNYVLVTCCMNFS